MLHFYTPWKRQKTKDFLTFLGGIEKNTEEYWKALKYMGTLLENG